MLANAERAQLLLMYTSNFRSNPKPSDRTKVTLMESTNYLQVRTVIVLVQRLCAALRICLQTFIGRLLLRGLGVRYGVGLELNGIPVVTLRRGASIQIGEHVLICSDRNTGLGLAHPVILRALAPGATIVIGDHVGMSGTTVVARSRVEIGAYCLIGANVIIADNDFHPIEPEGRRYSYENIQTASVQIGENVFIGANSIILKGVHVGKNSIIGAGSVVTKDIPANSVAAGNPCRVRRHLNELGNVGLAAVPRN